MKVGRRGDIGFLEAIMATMMVCMVLTAFTGFLAGETMQEAAEIPSFDRTSTYGVTITDGAYRGDLTAALQQQADRWGYAGLTIRCYSPGNSTLTEGNWHIGSMTGGMTGDRFLRDVPADDGRLVPTVFEVAACI